MGGGQEPVGSFLGELAGLAEDDRDAWPADLQFGETVGDQRTMAGLAAARVQGRVGGRPSVMDPDKLAAARARLARGESATQVAKALKVSRATLYRHTDVSVARGHAAAE